MCNHTSTMTKDTFWIYAFCLPTVAVLKESLLPEHITYVTDSLSQNAFVFKTWTYIGSSLAVKVTKGNERIFNEHFHGFSFMEQQNRLFIKYNKLTKEVSLLLNNVTRDDQGFYQIYAQMSYKGAKGFFKITGGWTLQLNVLEPSEIKQGYAGDTILITEFLLESIYFARLYHNYQRIADVRGSHCDVSVPYFGRIRCSKDTDNNTTRIEINHVTENDTGLYTVEEEGNLAHRCFLNITGTFTHSVSALTIVTPPDRFDENNSDQPNNITLSTTVLSGTAVNWASSQWFDENNSGQTRNITLPATVRSHTAVNQAHSITYTTNTNVLNIATAPESSKVIVSDQASNETLPISVFTRSPVNPANLLSVPIYVIAVIIGVVGLIQLIGCLIWSQRRKIHITKTEQYILQDESDRSLHLTPISLEPPLTLPLCQERKSRHKNIAQNKTLDPSTQSIDMAQMLSKDGYEVVDISDNDDPDITPELDEIIYESTENVNTPYSDTSGYLTVLARRETTV